MVAGAWEAGQKRGNRETVQHWKQWEAGHPSILAVTAVQPGLEDSTGVQEARERAGGKSKSNEMRIWWGAGRRGGVRKKTERPGKTGSQGAMSGAGGLAAAHFPGPGGWAGWSAGPALSSGTEKNRTGADTDPGWAQGLWGA